MGSNDTIYRRFKCAAQKYKDFPAVIENGALLTFRQLSALADCIAYAFPYDLKAAGVVLNHSAEMIAALLAILKCGAYYVPAEPSFPPERILTMMKEAQVDFVLTDKRSNAHLKGLQTRLMNCSVCARQAHRDAAARNQNENNPAYVLYTSGTTGRPKGVQVTNANVCAYADAFYNEFAPQPGDIMLQYSPCTFDIFVEEVFANLLNGAAIAIPSAQDKANVHTLMNFVRRHDVTMISGFPYLLAEMNHLPEIPSSLRLLISGGDVLRGIYTDNLLSQATVYNTYGPSETTVCASYYKCNGGYVLKDGTYPIGKPVKGVSITICDPQGNRVPDGETGEICIAGAGVSNGYIGDHDEENRAFITKNDGERVYKSGDLGYILPDKNIAFLRRKDSQVMIYGKRVEVSEVESTLYQVKQVRQAVVHAYTAEDGLSYMVAYIVPDGNNVKVSEIKKELSKKLTPYMIPEFFVKLPAIPLTENGKPDREKLPVVLNEGGTYEY